MEEGKGVSAFRVHVIALASVLIPRRPSFSWGTRVVKSMGVGTGGGGRLFLVDWKDFGV